MTDDYHKSADCWWFSLNAFLGTCWDRTVGYTPWRLGYTVKNSSLLHQAAPESFAAPLPLLQTDHSRWSLGTDCGCERPSLTARFACSRLKAQTWQWNGPWKMDWKVLQSIQKHQRWRVNVIYLFEVLKQGVSEELGCTILRSHTIQNSG